MFKVLKLFSVTGADSGFAKTYDVGQTIEAGKIGLTDKSIAAMVDGGFLEPVAKKGESK